MDVVSSNESLRIWSHLHGWPQTLVGQLLLRDGTASILTMARACVVFVHIPKTGGLSLGGVLRRQYKPTHTIHFSSLDKPLNEFEGIPYGERVRESLSGGTCTLAWTVGFRNQLNMSRYCVIP